MTGTFPQRVEILWHFWCPVRKTHVTEWIPGDCLCIHGSTNDGRPRYTVKADSDLEALDAHPDCVRSANWGGKA